MKKKVLNIANVKPNYYVGGMNAMVNQLNQGLKDLGFNSYLLFFNGESTDESFIKFNGLYELFSVLRKERFDVVIIHSIYHPLFPIISVLTKLVGSKLFIQSHGSLTTNAFFKPSIKKILYRPLIKLMLYLSDKFIFSNESEFHNSIIVKKERVEYIPNLIAYEPNEAIYKNHGNKFVFLGKIDFYYKGIETMLHAFQEIKKQGYEFQLDIFGYGENKSLSLQEMKTSEPEVVKMLSLINVLELNDFVTFHGLLEPSKRKIMSENYDALVLFSNSEAMPLVISEALGDGLPVIVNKKTNMSSYVETHKCGLVADTNAESSLREFIDLSDEDKREMSKSAKKCFDEFLNIKHLEKSLKEIEI
ncbi:glycosyltransferase [Pseudoalteromonas phenolica]|uniref:Glycosyl transferase family 1 domain-containing protein n=2 Tax=Pseudoalteromonas phenolica TaxID=161398 RepID=A0A0S2JXS1_9GAMM|nr:glycosyltransferase [Pseudoalteromonas phenolica]ALO40935.1 hypothetical protein PP2015_410 [Pseudoalteromonas phenolica]